MDSQEFLQKYSPIVKRHWLPLCLGLFGLIFFIYGLIALLGNSKASDSGIVFEPGQEQSLQNKTQIKVDVAGGVINPGVYDLAFDSRIQDALVSAGGLSEDADREWVSKNLNLAQKLADGTKIYIPKIGETETESIKGSKSIKGIKIEDKININTASIETLDSLSGVGPVTGQKIIDARPYSTIDDLLSKKVISQKVFGQIKEKITVY